MKNIDINLESFLIDIDKTINDNINGTNYLEILKKKLTEKLNDLPKNGSNNLNFLQIDQKLMEKEVNLLNRKLNFKIEYFNEFTSNKQKKIEKDTLYLIIEGINTVTIFDFQNNKKSIYCKLTKYMGVVLSSNTTISNKIAKKSIVLSISNN